MKKKLITVVMESLLTRTHAYFESEFKIQTENNATEGSCDKLQAIELFDKTAIIDLGGVANLMILFSIQDDLLNVLYEKMTKGLDILPEEIDMYRGSTVGEIANIVLGHCTADLQKLDRRGVTITPPIILDKVKKIQRLKDTLFCTQEINTPFGIFAISIVGSPAQFATEIDQE